MITEVRAPAKINLGLRILGLRPDGYHDIRSVFQEITLCDLLRIEAEPGDRRILLSCPGSDLPADRDNLAWRAAEAFLDRDRLDLRVSIELRKEIPVRAGLGGGSSDAAAVLSGLARITGVRSDLRELAAGLGSDVPFFLSGGSSLVEGRGERMSPVRVPAFHAVLLHPPVTVSTPWAYAEWDRRGASLTEPGAAAHDSASSAVWHEGKPFPLDLWNDFLPLLEERIPGMAELARFLDDSCGTWGLSGSGPTLYALFRTRREAERFSDGLPGGTRFSLCGSAGTAGA